ncbi:base excision DNA repair protein, HhHGPD subfamily protein [Acanthamoeba castellanii str. Neff]|uniref:Base excision DNA repair protein, HhHGPD subfamily protein n=1 Tax=Acanthamoeba castellanii (strain ATCC 30010 / Neff) TaxID=1257118 RepID=L8GJ45_ACACF|nr:base excision DNA repair protein, HhHGPD subfamily protein [Acanthamoeba castellanii str. Neff]ELR12778.1 base excision DNA repair protein, HhHGPD subfamily protein [Acanthamoeba castellanii str. Neff]
MIRNEDATTPVQEAATLEGDEIKIEVEAKPQQIVHAIAGGRTDDELKAFYREVHRKLAQHYPGTWLLVKDEKNKMTMKMEMKKEGQDEDDQMSEEEEEKELEREEEEMDKVEEMSKEEEEDEVVVKVEQPPTPQRRNPDRRKRPKLEIKTENDEGGAAGQAGDEADTRGKKSAAPMHTGIEKEKKKTNVCGGQKTVLASLISTVLSQNTTDRNSSAAWANLQRAYKEDWERVRTAKPSQLADVIRTGGLAQRKGGIIQGLLNQLHEERDGELSLEHLRDMPTEEVKHALTKYKGIGPKTASCVLMFNMKRADFPVDTHVHRVSTRLGFVRGTTREQTYEFMNATMPDEIKRDMHVLLIRHGKQVCKARSPKCGECVLRDDCRYGQTLKKEQEMADNSEDDVVDNKKKGKKSKRSRKEKSGAGAAKTKGKKKAKQEKKVDDDDEDFEEPTRSRRGKRAKAKDDTAAGGTTKRVAKRRRRSAPPASTNIGDIEDVV